ncbi:GxxExxY protein [Sphingopyxis sp. OPL5]|uniref:GxxExxY protein n=1 Tax=Sphingopyxis sp. OPL5 TaxID=2486273 RepID=UPI00164E5CDF|nr:GxxExxY protein [Sphingopyxis sp. OPL5]QNO26470.1 GxxExxY protein [Sphingopyxis sp. OPL5]
MGEAALHIDQISHDVIGVAMRLHSEIGPGLLESVYETLLAGRLAAMGYKVDRQWPINVVFDGIEFREVACADLVIDDRLVVEIKSTENLHPVHAKQVLTYLRLMHMPVGLLINFGEPTLKQGIRRLVNDHKDSASSASLREKTDTPTSGKTGPLQG